MVRTNSKTNMRWDEKASEILLEFVVKRSLDTLEIEKKSLEAFVGHE